MKAAIYARVSRDEQRENWSIPTQIAACRAHAERKSYEVVAVFQEDYTGSRINRPELDELMKLVVARKVEKVVVYVADRLTRGGSAHIGYFVTLFAQNGVELELARGELDQSEEGRMFLTFMGYAAKKHYDAILEATSRGLLAKVKSGKPFGRGQPPFGLRFAAPLFDERGEPLKGTVKAKYEIDPASYPWLRKMFALADAGEPISAIARMLNAADVPTPYGHRPDKRRKLGQRVLWTAASARHILTNRAYVGEGWQYCVKIERLPDGSTKRTRREKRDGDGDAIDTAIRLPDGVFPVAIEPDLFARVRIRLERNALDKRDSSCRPDRDPEIGLLRRGLIRCPRCGNALGVNTTGKGGASYQHQRMDGKRHGCRSASIQMDKIDAAIWGWVEALRRNPRRAAGLIERIRQTGDDPDLPGAMLVALDKQIAEIDAARARYVKQLGLVDDDGTATLIRAELKRLADDFADATNEREVVADRVGFAERRRANVERAVALIGQAPTDLSDLSYAERRRVLKDLGATVYLYPADHAPRWLLVFAFDAEPGGRPVSGVGYVGPDGRLLNHVWNPDFTGGGDEPIYDTEYLDDGAASTGGRERPKYSPVCHHPGNDGRFSQA